MKTTHSGVIITRFRNKRIKNIYFINCVIYFVFLLIFINPSAFAQSISNYSTSRITGISYSSIASTGNSFAGWRNTGTLIEDDNRSVATDIGFDFWYNGQRFTQFSVSTNGYLDFSSSADDGGPSCDDYGYCNSEFTVSANGTWLALAPFYDDMTTQGGSDPLGTSMKYLLTGTAPNRVLTVEWIDMAVFGNTSPNINFQVKLYETTGRIEYLYGNMVSGTNVFSYTIGINAASLSNPPQASQLKTQQTANSNTFNNTPQNNLSALPQSNSQISFVSPNPTAATGSLTFNSITRSGMTLVWPNWATNEVGYVLYSSTDNVNYIFHSQTAANVTSAAINNLLPGTTYYWRVYAVTEGAFSSALSNNATTLAARTVTSVSSGRWDANGTWDCNCVPTQTDNVFISNGHTIQLRSANMQCNNLTIGQGSSGVAQFTTSTAFTLTVNGNLTINNGGSFSVATTSNAIHTVNVRGNLVNSGSINFVADANSLVAINFTNTTSNQLVSGSGPNAFHTIAIDKGSKSNVLEISATNFSCNTNALTFTSGGTFKFSSTGANTFQLFNAARSIPVNNAIWMNSANSNMQFGATVNLEGDLRVDAGTVQIGNAADENLISFGGLLSINGGLLQVAGRYAPNTSAISRYQQSGGSIVCPTASSTATASSPFDMSVVGSSFTMSGGLIILQREGGSGAQNLGLNTSGVITSTVTAGTLQIGNGSTPASQTFLINAGTSFGNLEIVSSNAIAQLAGNNLTVLNNVTVSNGVLNDGGRTITFGGNWLISSGSFQSTGTGLVVANGANQSITTNGSAFNDLTLAGSGNKSLLDNLRVNDDLTFSATLIPVNAGFTCTLGGDWTNNGTFTRNSETILFNGSADQIISGSSLTPLTNISVNKTGGRLLINGAVDLHRLLSISSATQVDADGALGNGVLTLLSTGDQPTADASIAALPAGASVTGNVTVQRYMAPEVPGVTRVYRYISSPVSGRFLSDWQDDFPITGAFSNPNTEFPIGSGISTICSRPLAPNTASLFRYSEPATGTGGSDLGWLAYPASGSTTAATIEVGRGYAAFIRECSNPTVVDVRGPANQGTISFNSIISRTNNGNVEDGFNLVGNPFPSAIDWNTDAGWTRTGISPVIYVRDNGGTGGYITFDYTDNEPMVLATGQAFWVRVTSGTPNFSVNEQAKTTNAGEFYRSGEQSKMVITMSKDGVSDRAILKLNSESTARLDDFDGPKLDNTLFDISSLSEEGISMAVNSIDQVTCGESIRLRMKDVAIGVYQFSFDLQGQFERYNVVLFDKFTNVTSPLTKGSTYSFNVTNVPASKAADRFELRFAEIEVNNTLPITSKATVCTGENDVVTIFNSQVGVEYYSVLDNQIVSDTLIGTGSTITLLIPANKLKEYNEITVMASRACGGVFEMNNHVTVSVSVPKPPVALQTVGLCKSGSVTLSVEEPIDGIVQWFGSVDATEVLASGTSFNTPELTKSRTYFASVLRGECESNRIPIVATINSFDDVVIRQSGDTLISSYEVGNQWYRNGEILKTETSNVLVPTAPGLYRVVVQVSETCSTSAEIKLEDIITGDLQETVNGISAVPNPADDVILITTDIQFDDEIFVVNSLGQRMQSARLQRNENLKQVQLNLNSLINGFYYIEGTRHGKPAFLKILKAKS